MRIWSHIKYFILWPIGLFVAFNYLLPLYISLILTVWITYGIIEDDKEFIETPKPIQVFLSNKIKPIRSNIWPG